MEAIANGRRGMTRTIPNGTMACRFGPALLIALLLALAWAARPVMAAAEPAAAQFAQLDPRYDYDRARDMREAEYAYQQKAAKLAYERDKELRDAAADRAKDFAEARRDYEE